MTNSQQRTGSTHHGMRRSTLGLIAAVALCLGGVQRVSAVCSTGICTGGNPCTISGSNTVDCGCTLNFGTTQDVIVAGGATVQTPDNCGNSCLTVNSRDLTVRGTLKSRNGCVVVDIQRDFTTAVVSNSAGTIDVSAQNESPGDAAAEASITAVGTVTLNGKDITANSASGAGQAGDIAISGTSVSGSSPLDASGSGGAWGGSIDVTATSGSLSLTGAIDASGNGGGNGGDVTLTSTSSSASVTGAVNASGNGTTGTLASGGTILVDGGTSATAGASNKNYDVQGHGDGDGGLIDVEARNGTATVNGNLNANGNGDFSFGGEIDVNGSSVTTGTTWNARGDQSGFGGSISIGALPGAGNGSITTTSGSNSFNTIGGSGGGDGGDIDLSANGNITLAGDMDAGGRGEFAFAGTISIDGGTSAGETVTIQSTSTIVADATGADISDGEIDVSGCKLSISGTLDTRNTSVADGFGVNALTYLDTLTQNSGSSLLADNTADGGANDIYCRCVDTSPADGVCDTPLTCITSPTLSGTVNPTATIHPTLMNGCS